MAPAVEELDLRLHTVPAGTESFRCYDGVRGYDTDRVRAGAGSWRSARPGLRALAGGPGRDLVDEVAECLGAVVVAH